MESMLPRLIHLLAHHPDFAPADRTDEDLLTFATYFIFFFDLVVTSETLTLVYHYAQRIKQVEDSLCETGNENSDVRSFIVPSNLQNIYILADIAQIVIAAKAETHSWPLLAYPKKLKLPVELFRAPGSTSEANEKQSRSFLTQKQSEMIKAKIYKTARMPRTSKESAPATPNKRSSNGSSKHKKKRTKRASMSPPLSERRSSARAKSKVVVYNESVGSESGSDDADSDSDSD